MLCFLDMWEDVQCSPMEHTPHGIVKLPSSGNHILLNEYAYTYSYRFADLKTKTSYPSHRLVFPRSQNYKCTQKYEVAPSGTQKKGLLQEEGISLNTNAAISRAMRAVSHRTP